MVLRESIRKISLERAKELRQRDDTEKLRKIIQNFDLNEIDERKFEKKIEIEELLNKINM